MKKIINFFFTIVSFSLQAQTNLIAQDTISVCGNDSINLTISGNYNLYVWNKTGSYGLIVGNTLTARQSGQYKIKVADSSLGDTTICFTTTDASPFTFITIPNGYIITDVLIGYYGTPITNCSNPMPGSCHIDVRDSIKGGLIGKTSFQYYQGALPDMCTGIPKTLFVKLRCNKYIEDSVYISIIKPISVPNISDTSFCSPSSITYTLPAINCDTTYVIVDSLILPCTSNNSVTTVPLINGKLYRLKVESVFSLYSGTASQSDGAYAHISTIQDEFVTWRIDGMQYGSLPDFRPFPNVYNPNNIYYYYLIGDGLPLNLSFYDCCLGDNSGSLTFVLEEEDISNGCNSQYKWSNGIIGNTATFPISSNQNYLMVTDGIKSCIVDSFLVNGLALINSNPSNIMVIAGANAQFIVNVNPTYTLQWQTDSGSGFQNVTNSGQYIGANNDTLIVSNVTMTNNNQLFRCIVINNSCDDTSSVAILTVKNADAINNYLADGGIKIYPNPTINSIAIQVGSKVIGSSYKIFDDLGRVILSGIINNETTTIDTNPLHSGMFILQIGTKRQAIQIN